MWSIVKGFWRSWGAVHWVLVVAVVILASQKVYKRQEVRVKNSSLANVEIVEEDIKKFNTLAERLGQMEELPPVKAQWQYIVAIANEFGVKLKRQSITGDGYYSGPLASWDGEVSGATGAVLVVGNLFQETVPTYLYEIAINADRASLKFSVLGGN